MRFLRRSEPATDTSNIGLEKSVYPSALRITAPLFPSVATIVTVITYLVGDEIAQITGASWKTTSGDFAVLIGLLAGILIWFTVRSSIILTLLRITSAVATTTGCERSSTT